MSTDTTDSQETDAPHNAGTPPNGIRCDCGSEQLVLLQTTIEIEHAIDRERREWQLRCADCTQIGTVSGQFGGGFRRLSPTLKRVEGEH